MCYIVPHTLEIQTFMGHNPYIWHIDVLMAGNLNVFVLIHNNVDSQLLRGSTQTNNDVTVEQTKINASVLHIVWYGL